MCSYEDRIKAVRLYLKLGKRLGVTIRQLGYLSRITFSKWLDELHPDVRMRMVGRAPNVQYPMETKKAAVLELYIRDTSAEEIAKKVKVCRPTLYNWNNELLDKRHPH